MTILHILFLMTKNINISFHPLNFNYATPDQACSMPGEQTKKLKNYYENKQSHKSDDDIILSFKADVMTDLQTPELSIQKSINL